MQRLNYNQLYYFYIVATEGSVKSACEKLHLTQPTISGQIRTLEEDLGFDLFERKHRKLVLNERGKEILKKAEKIFVMGDELINNLPSKYGAPPRQSIRIGKVPTLPSSFLHRFTIKAWKDRDIALHIINEHFDHLAEQLDEDEIDIILSDNPIAGSKKYRSVNLEAQRLSVFGTENFSDLKNNFPGSINRAPMITYSKDSQVQSDTEYFFKLNNIKPDIMGSVDDVSLMRQLAEKGLCIAILPDSEVRHSLKEKKLMRIGSLREITSNRWAITSESGSKKILIRKIINDFLVKKRR